MAAEPISQYSESHDQVSVQVDLATYERLLALAQEQDLAIARVIARAVDTYDRVSMVDESNAAYVRLRADPNARAHWQAELGLWESMLMDGIRPDE
jgi:hypothetical protein